MLHEVVVVASHVDGLQHVVVRVVLIEGAADLGKQVLEVVVSDREFLEEAVDGEEFESEVQDGLLSQLVLVLEEVEVPLVEVVHDLDHVVPDSRLHPNKLFDALFFLL